VQLSYCCYWHPMCLPMWLLGEFFSRLI